MRKIFYAKRSTDVSQIMALQKCDLKSGLVLEKKKKNHLKKPTGKKYVFFSFFLFTNNLENCIC